jgi:hypothetical protein
MTTRLLWGMAAAVALLLAVGGAVLAALSLPAVAVGQEGAPTLKEALDSGFPDRVYVLQLTSPRTLESGDVAVAENGAPVAGEVGVEPPDSGTGQIGTQLSSEYLVTYRSLLPPGQKVEVTAAVDGVGSATASYTTPHIDFTEPATSEESWIDDVIRLLFLMVLVVTALFALFVFARAR